MTDTVAGEPPPAEDIEDANQVLINAAKQAKSTRTQLTLHSPSSHNLACSAWGCNPPLTTTNSTKWPMDSYTSNGSTSKTTTATHYTQTPTHVKTTEKEFKALLISAHKANQQQSV